MDISCILYEHYGEVDLYLIERFLNLISLSASDFLRNIYFVN